MKNGKIFKALVSTATAVMLFAPAVMPYENTTTEQSSTSVIQFIEAEAASYSTGTYQVNTSAGCNVRKGAGTGYAKLGAAANGTQFKVTKVSGSWGYGTIKCTNGNKTGWICLTYCKAVSSYVTPLENGAIYWITPACATGSVVDIEGVNKNAGANALLYSKAGGVNQKNQQFMAIKKGNYYVFQAVHSGKVLDISGGAAKGKNIIQWNANGGDNQSWYLCDAGGGYYYIKSKMNTNICMDVCNSSNKNGTNICAWDFHGANNQRFKFTKVNNPVPNPNNKTKLSSALYNNGSAKLTCGFDGYTTTSGRHEGIDISLSNGSNVYSLTDGVVLRVAKGYQGSSGLSTIAIYYSAQNKTVIYLHSNPCVSNNQKISKGQKIATQDWRGCSSASIGHTHVEVRNGKQSYAAKSVKDYTLENSNPTSFWNSLGYSIG